MIRLAANLSLMFTEHPLLERPAAAAAAGFRAVEMQFPYEVPAPDLASAAREAGVAFLLINTPRGSGTADLGVAAQPGQEAAFDEAIGRALDYATALGAGLIHTMAGRVAETERAEAERTYVANLRRAAQRAAEAGVTLVIEPLNRRDMPGYFLNSVEEAARLAAAVDHPNVGVLFDTYHIQILDGDLLTRFRRHLPLIKHVQIAAVPDRGEPDAGEVDHGWLLPELERAGWGGWIAAEYRPRAGTLPGLGWARRWGVEPR